MRATTTNIYRERIARAIQGETALPITPVTAQLGTGRASGTLPPSPENLNLDQPVITGLAVTVTRLGHTLTITSTIVGGATPVAISEAGLFSSDGVALMLASFAPVTLQAGLTYVQTWTLYPEVVA